jgi:hypothetical protein
VLDLQRGEVLLHRRQPIRPVPVLGHAVAEREIGPVDPGRRLHDGGEGVARRPVGRDRVTQVLRVLRALVERIRQPGPHLAREEPGEPGLRRDVHRHPAEGGCRGISARGHRLPQRALGVVGEPLEPPRHLGRAVTAAAPAGEQVVGVVVDPVEQPGVEGAGGAEGARFWRVEVVVPRARPARQRHVDVHLGPVVVVRRARPVRDGDERQHPARRPERRLEVGRGRPVLVLQEPAP